MDDFRHSGLHHLREEVDRLGERLQRIESAAARERLRGQIDQLRRRIDALMLPIETKIYRRLNQPRARAPLPQRDLGASYRRQRP